MRKNILFILSVSILCFLLAGCSEFPWGSPIREDKQNGEGMNISTESPPLNPSTEKVSNEPESFSLYFRFGSGQFLTSDTREMNIPAAQRKEKFIVEELIKGPSPDKIDLQPLFNPNVKVIEVSDNNDYLFVTLSKEFLNPPEDAPENWKEDEKWKEEIDLRRRLAVYSIVNSLTELGEFSRVQILIGDGENEEGERIKLSEVGFNDATNKQLLEPLGRNSYVILTPMNTMNAFLAAFLKKDWDAAYLYIATQDGNNVPKPSLEEFKTNLSSLNPTLESYEVLDETVSNDGQTAIVSINFKIKMKDGKVIENTNVPIKLLREREIWKVIYPAVNNVFVQ